MKSSVVGGVIERNQLDALEPLDRTHTGCKSHGPILRQVSFTVVSGTKGMQAHTQSHTHTHTQTDRTHVMQGA